LLIACGPGRAIGVSARLVPEALLAELEQKPNFPERAAEKVHVRQSSDINPHWLV